MPAPFSEIDRDALLDRLAGDAASITVLTPNRRLAQALETELDRIHLAAGRAQWDAADILAVEHFLVRSHDEAHYAPEGADIPTRLGESAARILWEDAIAQSRWRDGLLSLPAAAALASEAWALAHRWRIEGALRAEQGSEDAEAFAEWAQHYARRTERDHVIDEARLPQEIARCWAAKVIAPPKAIALYAFDLVTPQQSDLLMAAARLGTEVHVCQPARHEAKPRRVIIETPREEIEQAARWARARLEAAAGPQPPRIAVVVPGLEQRRREVARVFSRTFMPNASVEARGGAPLFNLSLGEPLSEYPIVDAALTLLEIASDAVTYDRASRLIRSPFIADAEAEVSGRARLDAGLRRIAPGTLTAVRLRAIVPDAVRRGAPACKGFIRLLEDVIAKAADHDRAGAFAWADRFTKILRAAGFPGERSLDSVEFQALEKWREVLAEFASLGSVAGAWSGREARARLVRLCRETVFQPKSGQAPVQVLGILESAGLSFDHLWVSGLTEDAWPIAVRPHPLIAPALQRRAGIPQASPEEALEVDRRITDAWRTAAPEVTFSSARAEGDRELVASPLVAGVAVVPLDALGIPAFVELRRQLLAARKAAISKTGDDAGPALPQAAAKGGTGILVDQAACPFRAFAHYRLGARELEVPESGLAPLERGTLLHEMMGKLWETLKDQRTLVTTDEAALAGHIDAAAAYAIKQVQEQRPGRLEGRFADLERERIAQLAREWLAIEKLRSPFTVHQREEKWKLAAGPIEIDGRIDRVDELDGEGGLAIIDYKTGRVAAADWNGDRPDNAQLPLYALAADRSQLQAVAFASLKTGDLRFVGVAREEGLLPRVKKPTEVQGGSWDGMLDGWRIVVDRLGSDFAAGKATVDPKELLTTCKRCDLKSLCRVHERLSPLDEGDELKEEGGEEEGE